MAVRVEGWGVGMTAPRRQASCDPWDLAFVLCGTRIWHPQLVQRQ